jgi:putative phage-type endonuclease
MENHMAEQGTTEWLMEKVGKVGASKAYTVSAKQKNGSYYADRETYLYEIAVEQLTGRPTERITNQYMDWGTKWEPEARNVYAATTFEEVNQVGFIPHPFILNSGCSPDGVVGNTGLVEFKCPTTKTHVNTIRSGEVPKIYYSQVQWQLACLPEREWVDFASYDPRMPEKGQLFVKRVNRDKTHISMLEEEIKKFLEVDVANVIKEINEAMEKL